MDANLHGMSLSLVTAMSSPFPSVGSTLPLQVKTSIFWSGRRLISNSSHLLSYSWECSGLGLALNMIMLESVTTSASTDPTMQTTCNLVEFQGPLPTFGMPFSFRCTGLIVAFKVALLAAPLKIQWFNQADSNDSVVFFED